MAEALAAATAAASGAAEHGGQATAPQLQLQAVKASRAAGSAPGPTQPLEAHSCSAAASLTPARVPSCTCCGGVRPLPLNVVAAM